MVLKDYQGRLLDAFEGFLARTRELGGPEGAFAESTREAFGYTLPYHPLPGAETVPYVCLRVPTGGGKTRLAGHAIKRVARAFLSTTQPLVLWLVPSDPIREQTLYALQTPGELLNADMLTLFGGVQVLGVTEALAVQPATLASAPTIIVSTMQSFKRESADGLRVYRPNGALMPHFSDVPAELKGEGSLVDLIRLHRPFVVVDEAHNQGQPIAIETLARLNPSCVLELTATPDRISQPSNVLRSVSAATLQAEDMLKLPLELAVHAEWRITLREAINRLRALEKDAAEEAVATGETIAPLVMLIQAERRSAHAETFTPERVKQHLVDDFAVPAESIAIATGELDEIAGKRPTDPGYPQFIITVDKLREGWDCPTAYVLFTFRNTTSATAVEQVLGRVLRMPHVRRKQHEALNRSYAYVVSEQLAETVQGLRDGLVQNGFERLETKDLIALPDIGAASVGLFTAREDVTVPLPAVGGTVEIPDGDALATLPKVLRDRVTISPETGTLTIKAGATAADAKKVAEMFRAPDAAKTMQQSIDTVIAARVAPAERMKTPAEQGVSLAVPMLLHEQGGLFDVFGEGELLDADWEIDSFDHKLTEAEFSHDIEAMRRATLSMSQLERVTCDIYDKLDSQLALLDAETGWAAVTLVEWLDHNLPFPYATREQKVAWINGAVTWLLEQRAPAFTLEELAYRKFRLRGAIERKLAAGLALSKQRVFNELLGDESRFAVRDEHAIVLKQGSYAYDTPYVGLLPLRRHFFPVIGNLKGDGEEFNCAEYIANRLEGVETWVRNVERKPTSFWLQTSSDKFYPDFLVKATNGAWIAVEYKGAHIADNADSREKKRIGELWERRSGGKCAFAWVEGKNWAAVADAVRRCEPRAVA